MLLKTTNTLTSAVPPNRVKNVKFDSGASNHYVRIQDAKILTDVTAHKG